MTFQANFLFLLSQINSALFKYYVCTVLLFRDQKNLIPLSQSPQRCAISVKHKEDKTNRTMEPQGDWNTSEKSKLLQPGPPPYQDHLRQPPPGNFQSTSGYQAQQYGASGPYGQGPYPGHAAVTVQPAVYPVPQGPYTQGPYPGQPVVTVQPAVFVTAAPLADPVPDYLGYSIFTMLCCCLPLGIAALIYSISVSILVHVLSFYLMSLTFRSIKHTTLMITDVVYQHFNRHGGKKTMEK
uniref:Si:dkey-33i11.9 n=2 Tax=Cyprinus carpio TaxID=7962 RepID=A0A9J7XAH2_CYPCA